MQLTPRTFKKNKIYSPSSSINERSRYSSTSESKKQIKVQNTFEKDKISLGCIQQSNKRNQTENKHLFYKKLFEFDENEIYMESHSLLSKSKNYNFRR